MRWPLKTIILHKTHRFHQATAKMRRLRKILTSSTGVLWSDIAAKTCRCLSNWRQGWQGGQAKTTHHQQMRSWVRTSVPTRLELRLCPQARTAQRGAVSRNSRERASIVVQNNSLPLPGKQKVFTRNESSCVHHRLLGSAPRCLSGTHQPLAHRVRTDRFRVAINHTDHATCVSSWRKSASPEPCVG